MGWLEPGEGVGRPEEKFLIKQIREEEKEQVKETWRKETRTRRWRRQVLDPIAKPS